MQLKSQLKRKLRSKAPAIVGLLLVMSQSAHTLAQNVEYGPYMSDPSTIRFKELEIAFQALYGEITYKAPSSVNEEDQALVRKAITETPYYVESLQVSAAACTQFSSVDESTVDIERVVALITQGDAAEYEGKERFLENVYESLSSPAKGEFNRLIDIHSETIETLEVKSLDIEKFLEGEGREATVSVISRRCERLPLAIEMFESGVIDITSLSIQLCNSELSKRGHRYALITKHHLEHLQCRLPVMNHFPIA